MNLANFKRWATAFPSSSLPLSKEIEQEKADFQIAKKLCPKLYVDPKIFEVERTALASNLKISRIEKNALALLMNVFHKRNSKETTQAVFNMFSLLKEGRFEYSEKFARQDTGARLWLLSHLDQIYAQAIEEQCELIHELVPEDRVLPILILKMRERAYNQKKSLQPFLKELDTKASLYEIKLSLLRDLTASIAQNRPTDSFLTECIRTLFLDIFKNNQSPTCVIKYHVVHHKTDPNLICIQYFFYWPIQVWPLHFFDYEPIYVYAYKNGDQLDILSVSFNSLSIIKAIKKMILSFFRKRPGHIIKLFFNEKAIDDINKKLSSNENLPGFGFHFGEYDELANFMTEAYGGKYVYQRAERHLHDLLDKGGHIALSIPNILGIPLLWHAFDLCSSSMKLKESWLLDCPLLPLNSHDMLHIEWNTENPFQAPFLYPIVGKKDPAMHLPFDFIDLYIEKRETLQRRWHDFCRDEWNENRKSAGRGKTEIYKMGLLIELLYDLQNKTKQLPNKLWLNIEKWNDYLNDMVREEEIRWKTLLDKWDKQLQL